MAFRLQVQESFLKAIPRIARERIDRVVESLRERPKASGGAIHEARKNLKSLRALLRLSRGSINDEVRFRENFLFRDAGRSLSAIRDPQALLEALEYFNQRHRGNSEASTPKREAGLAFIEKLRSEIERNLVDGVPPGDLKKLLRELRDARRRTAQWCAGVLVKQENEWEVFVGTGLRRTYRNAKRLVWQFEVIDHLIADDKTWHELRKCAKALGYQLRLLKPIWPGMMSVLVDEIDQLTDHLGDANDISILREKIMREPYDPLGTQESEEIRRSLLQSLDRRKQRLHSEAFHLARFVYAETPRQFERRLAGYWRIWRSQNQVKVLRRPVEIDGQTGRQQGRQEILASSPS
ncbi:MAG: CHAD domain-containing protein [Verrucomicrobia bacterium]|nr:CHAD domain-containing protein [Verrucomicrobiota bacterium]